MDALPIALGVGSLDRQSRVAMSHRLMAMQPVFSYPLLFEVLSADNWRARGNAAFLLGKIPPPTLVWRDRALDRLTRLLAKEPSDAVREVARHAQAALRPQEPPTTRRAKSPSPTPPRKGGNPGSKKSPPWKPPPESSCRPYALDENGGIIWL